MKVNRTRNRGARITSKLNIPKDYHWKCLGALVQDLKAYLSSNDLEKIQGIIRSRDFAAYLKLDDVWGLRSINLEHDPQFTHVKARYAVSSLLKKYLPGTDKHLKQAALDKFLAAEERCKLFNDELCSYLTDGTIRYNRHLLAYMKGFLQQLLGDQVPVRDIVEEAKHGPGANLDTQNGDVSIFSKYVNFPYSCTPGSVGYAIYMIQTDERWFRALKTFYMHAKSCDEANIDWVEFWDYFLSVVDYNRITFVPKNAKTMRSIAIEPALNIMLQLGVDKFIRRRLKRWGIDLDSQESNRQLSRVGSKWGIYATIDLSAASDTISLALCKEILPIEWYDFLIALRAPKGQLKLDGNSTQVITYEKISSMGNGYTFVLESAIFAAVVHAVHKMKNQPIYFGINAAVFGDDIIVRGDMYEDVESALEVCGFQLNREKSFNTGPIRESCGMDWFQGLSIRPLFLSEPPSSLQEIFVDYNRGKRFLDLLFGIKDSKFCSTILQWIPKELQFEGPYSDEVFDSWLHSDRIPVPFPGGYRFRRLLRIPKKRTFSSASQYGYRFFHMLCHNLRSGEKPRFYELKRIKMQKGSRFTVDSREFIVKQKPADSTYWQSAYTLSLPFAG